MAALSISCQVFTAPLAWLRFHSFPTYFLLTNLLALPLTGALMGTSLLTLGLEAIGVDAELRTYVGQAWRDTREVAARVKDYFYGIFKPKPTYLGDRIDLKGNAQVTWD